VKFLVLCFSLPSEIEGFLVRSQPEPQFLYFIFIFCGFHILFSFSSCSGVVPFLGRKRKKKGPREKKN